METARTAILMVLGIVLPLVVQLWDERTMSAEARARVWGYATWGSALYAFGPASMLGWCWVTRPRWRRVWLGPLWLGGLLFALTLLDALSSLLLSGTSGDFAIGEALALSGAVMGAGGVLLVIMELLATRIPRRQLEVLVTALAIGPFAGVALAFVKVLLTDPR